MKNLLFVRKSNPQVGGVEMQMLRIATWLRDHGNIQASLATDNLNSPLAKLFLDHQFNVYACKLSGRFYLFSAVKQICKIVDQYEITFLQAHMFRESTICRFVKLFRTDVINIFRIETYIDCSSISDFKKMLYHKLAYLTKNLVDYHIANGNLVARELCNRSGVSKSHIKVVFNGVEKFGITDMLPIEKSKDGFLPVAMVANFVRGKGHELLFDVISELRKKNINVRVSLFGDDLGEQIGNSFSYKQELILYSQKLGLNDHIVFRGFANNLAKELENFRIVLLPSFSEGTPNTILEAMSVRKLVIVSDAGELEFMVEDGKSGFVHKIGDQSKLREILEKVYTNDSSNFDIIRENGYQRWKSLFSLDGMMHEMREIYRN